jgi:nitrous oxidase accessory protein
MRTRGLVARSGRALPIAVVALSASLGGLAGVARAQGAHAKRAAASASGSGAEIVVSPDGPVRRIGDAVRAAEPGTRIVVTAGTYREPTIVVDRAVTLEGRGWPVLDGEGKRELIRVTADDVTVRGLVLRDVGTSFVEDRAALRVMEARHCVIEGNRIERGFFGIYLGRTEHCRVSHNTLNGVLGKEEATGNGIHLWSSTGTIVEHNGITGHRDGIYLEFSSHATVRGNVSAGNLRYGLHFMYADDCEYVDNTFRGNGAGVAVMYTKRIAMVGNRFERNWGAASYGLLLKEILDARVEGNTFDRNTVGLMADGANRLRATGNVFTGNGWAIQLLASTDDATVERNDFSGNTFDVSTNSRTSSARFAGNWWDDYRGYDLDRDGVGDVPHRPVRLFSILVERHAPAMMLMRSLFVGMLDAAERMLPALTPEAMTDATPAMHRVAMRETVAAREAGR